MNEQMSLFDSDSKLLFDVCYCNPDWTIKTKASNNVVDGYKVELTKRELKEMCRKSVSIKRFGSYVYRVRLEEFGIKKELTIRFENYTTSKMLNVFEHIDLYFDQVKENDDE